MIPTDVRRAACRELTAADVRFWSHVDLHGPRLVHRLGRCWTWTGAASGNGRYGRVRVNGKNWSAHRYALSMVEPLVAGLEVDHRCRNTRCVRPSHLEQVTGVVNRQRTRGQRTPLAACRRAGHKLVGDNRVVRRDGKVECRECRRIKQLAWWHANNPRRRTDAA